MLSPRLTPLGRTLLLGLAGITLGLAGSAQAQIHPPKDGGPMHPAYLERVARDRTAFQFQKAWIAETERVRENRRLRDLGILDGSALGGGVVVSGNRFVPVIAGKFSNTGADPYTVTDLQNQLFDGPNPTGTMADYYDEISYSNIVLDGTVFGDGDSLYTVSNTDTYYEGGGGCNGLCVTSNVGEFIEELLVASDGTADFGQYDNDGPDNIPNSGDDDGFVDFVAFVHPEFGGECGGDDIWSHRWVVGGWSNFGGNPWTTNDAAFGGGFIQVWDYTIQPLISCDTTSLIEIGVYAHEFGHAFGLPDLYDTNSGNGTSQGIGEWGLMASGSYGGDGNHPEQPSHMCAWSKEQLGWVQPTLICGDAIGLDLKAVTFNPDVYKIYPHGIDDPEYFLVENRAREGFDKWIHNSGLTVWHIDNNQPGNGDETMKLVDLEEADGQGHLDAAVNRGDAGDVYPGVTNNTTFDDTSNPNSKDVAGAATGFSLTAISGSSGPDSSRTFNVTVAECRLRVANVVVDDAPCGNNNGTIDSNELADLEICLGNDFVDDVTGAYGILTSLTPGVTVTQDSVSYGTVTCLLDNCGAAKFSIEVTVALTAGQSVDFQLDLFGDSAYSSTSLFSLSAGQYVLLVEDDAAAAQSAEYTAAITAAGYAYVHHNTAVSGPPTAGQMDGALATVWYTGAEYDNTFTALEQDAVTGHLDNGGALFVTGQDIGYDLIDQGSATDQTFYEDYFHANFLTDDSGDNTLTGVGGDPIGNGINLSLDPSSDYPSVISARSGASYVFNYSAANYGAVRYETGHRLAYFAFMYEAEINAGTQNLVMDRVLSYLITGEVTPPSATLTAPTGGGSYDSCDSLLITWTASDNVAVTEVELYASYDSGATWSSIALVPGNPGSYYWHSGGLSSANTRIKVIARDAGALQGVDWSASDFTLAPLTPPSVVQMLPNGGESLEANSLYDVTWSMLSMCSPAESTQVLFSLDNGSSWNPMATVSAPDTTFSWSVADTTADSCLVRVEVFDGEGNSAADTSDAVFNIFQSTTGVGDDFASATTPVLMQNFPNPFQRSTRFSFYLPEDATVSLRVFDLTGRLVRTVVNGTMAPGLHEEIWDGQNDVGRVAAGGVYFYVLDTPQGREVRKLIRMN